MHSLKNLGRLRVICAGLTTQKGDFTMRKINVKLVGKVAAIIVLPWIVAFAGLKIANALLSFVWNLIGFKLFANSFLSNVYALFFLYCLFKGLRESSFSTVALPIIWPLRLMKRQVLAVYKITGAI